MVSVFGAASRIAETTSRRQATNTSSTVDRTLNLRSGSVIRLVVRHHPEPATRPSSRSELSIWHRADESGGIVKGRKRGKMQDARIPKGPEKTNGGLL